MRWRRTYVATRCGSLQAHDTALVVADARINVVRRGSDGAWRYAIALLDSSHPTKEKP